MADAQLNLQRHPTSSVRRRPLNKLLFHIGLDLRVSRWGPQKVRYGPATGLQPRLPSHGLHFLLRSIRVLAIECPIVPLVLRRNLPRRGGGGRPPHPPPPPPARSSNRPLQ